MKKAEMSEKWEKSSEEIISGIIEWREQHPLANMVEIETEIDQRLSKMRARMIADVAMASQSTEWKNGEETGKCPICGTKLEKKGKKKRKLQTRGGNEIELEREYGECKRCGAKIFPPG